MTSYFLKETAKYLPTCHSDHLKARGIERSRLGLTSTRHPAITLFHVVVAAQVDFIRYLIRWAPPLSLSLCHLVPNTLLSPPSLYHSHHTRSLFALLLHTPATPFSFLSHDWIVYVLPSTRLIASVVLRIFAMSSSAPPAGSTQDTTANSMTDNGSLPKKQVIRKTPWAKPCAVLLNDPVGPIVASGSALGWPHLIEASLVRVGTRDSNPWMGFTLSFPLPEGQSANDESGFGVRYTCM